MIDLAWIVLASGTAIGVAVDGLWRQATCRRMAEQCRRDAMRFRVRRRGWD